ncbi:hypothetical protein Mgra_00002152 [Meloidogyne graminicola]|uniref:Uncharacterized protein n=1 Tax=Meloidogyne graminicola TaxID=189291 RepID=A0A8S9ZZZ5_9BILA|nr:hypothetical protein Mgra_00002152 [Meloidogyne graminicola]
MLKLLIILNILIILFLNIIISIEKCDIIIHLKSMTNTPFSAKIIAPNGQISEKWTFLKNKQKETFHPLINGTNDYCTKGQWEIQTFDQNGIQKGTEKIYLNGIGRVLYIIKDNNLQPIQIERQGAKCNEEKCAKLANIVNKPKQKNNSSN